MKRIALSSIVLAAAIALPIAGKTSYAQAAGSKRSTPPSIVAIDAKRRLPAKKRIVSVPMGGGEFSIVAKIGGVPIVAIIDTGATGVVINSDEAHKLGSRLTYTGEINKIQIASDADVDALEVMIPEIVIGPIRVANIEGYVMKCNANVIGLSFLTRLKRFSIENYVAILEQ